MSAIISTGGQTTRKNSYDSSSEAKLTLRVNGEEKGVVIPPNGTPVRAGFDAPTVAPSVSLSGAGNVPEGHYYYRYVYASSRYPFVANAVTGDGEEWPRSNPSPGDNIQVTPTAQTVSVQVTYTTRSDVDFIWVYRTATQTSAADATAANEAGQLFYVGRIANNTGGGTGTFTDNEAADTGEILELDNFLCPLFRFTRQDGFYWWGFGNTTLTTVVTLDGTTTFSIDTAESDVDEWFSGRDGYTISFQGITTGGYDGRGNYYFKAVTTTTGQAFAGSDLLTPTTIPATGTTTAYLTAPGTTLYRSKDKNPFSWGRTTELNNGVSVSDLWAERIGGGIGTGLSLIPNERILKLDTEGPQKSYALDLNAADNSDFIGTLRTLDEAQSCSSHFSQYPMRLQNGQTVLTSVNAKAFQLLSADGQSQIPIGDNVKLTLDSLTNDHPAPDFYHGIYDYRTELNCWFVKTTDADDVDDLPLKCDTLIYQHAPTGQWGIRYYPGISASCTIFDEVTRDHYTFVGDEWGKIGILFDAERYRDWIGETASYPRITVPINFIFSNAELQIIARISSFIVSSNTAQVITATAHGLSVGDYIYISGAVANNHYCVTLVDSATEFTVDIQYPDGDYSADMYAVTDVYDFLPCATQVPTFNVRYMIYRLPPSGPDVDLVNTIQIPIDVDEIRGINLDTGESFVGTDLVALDGQNFSMNRGAIPCIISRYWNTSNPSGNKRIVSTWTSEVNADTLLDGTDFATHLWRFYVQYTSGPQNSQHVINPKRDVIGISATPADVFLATSPPCDINKSFGIDFQDFGYSQYRMLDFTLNITGA
jgi:hypothetical protein